MDGRKAGTSFIVSELYAASFQPLGPCRVCGQNAPPSTPPLRRHVARKQSACDVYRWMCRRTLFFLSLSLLLPLCTLRDNISREGTIQQQGMEEYSYSLFFVDRNLFVVRKLEGGGYACDNNFFESLQTIEKGEKVEG